MPLSTDIARRRLDAARLLGSAALATLGQFAVDAPQGYFGPTDQMTPVGIGFLAVVVGLALLGAALRLNGSRLYLLPAIVQVGVVLAAFVPPLASDPVVAAAEIFWHLYIFSCLAAARRPLRHGSAWRARIEPADREIWRQLNGGAALHLLSVSLIVAVAVLGYRLGDRVPALLIALVVGVLAIALVSPFLLSQLRRRSAGPVLVLLLLAAAVFFVRRPEVGLSMLAAAQVVTLALLLMETRLFADVLEVFYSRPAYLVLASFVVLIALGTLFLSFPVASAHATPVHPIDALFTATSATCVTGLIVLDTPRDFSRFGLVVILLLIQVGGLNIMVLSAFAAVLLGRGLGLRGEGALGDVLDLQPGRPVRRLVIVIVVGTLLMEATGAGVLTGDYLRHGYGLPAALWYGAFHAVSAFCNAGFSLHSDSLIGFNRDPLMLSTIALLITLGGLGFGVLDYVWVRLTVGRSRSAAVQSRVVLYASAGLVAVGALAYGLTEWNASLAALGPVDRVINALFQSVTLRTAGFNSVPIDGVHPATMLGMMAWMFIGASPGGTGGGIKTTTAVVLVGALLAILGRRERVVLLRHRITLATVYRSAAIAVVATIIVFAGAAALLATQHQSFSSLLFETFSAFGTVGLSLGATPHLDEIGKAIVVLLMLAGRVGPLTFALLLGQGVPSRVTYPEARIMVG